MKDCFVSLQWKEADSLQLGGRIISWEGRTCMEKLDKSNQTKVKKETKREKKRKDAQCRNELRSITLSVKILLASP